jgi:hypothetical protein
MNWARKGSDLHQVVQFFRHHILSLVITPHNHRGPYFDAVFAKFHEDFSDRSACCLAQPERVPS